MNEGKLSEAQAKGSRSQTLLNDPLLKECFTYLHDEYIAAWKRTSVKDSEAREKLWQAVQLLGLVQDHLKKFVSDGKIASRDLAQIKYLKR